MNEPLLVTKRNGEQEVFDAEKMHRVLEWAAAGLVNVSVSNVELKARIQLFQGISTDAIHQTLTKSAADLIDAETPDYQYMAAHLAIFRLRKMAFGDFGAPTLQKHIEKLVGMNLYDKSILKKYSPNELSELDAYIDHNRDLELSYAAVKQLEGKYLVQNRVTKQVFENPQFLFMLVSMCLFEDEKLTRLQYVKNFYDAVSQFKVSLPTPIMSGVRTPTRQFSSCTVIECGDSLDSINATSSAVVKYVSQRAGIGLNMGQVRAVGSPIRGGEARHTGVLPFIKLMQAAVKSCSQGGVRGGAATIYFPLWHLEIQDIIVLKNNRGVEENRARHLDYGIQINRLMYTRLIKGSNITLFSPSDVPGLYDAFFADQDEFERLYQLYEKDESIRKRSLPAADLFSLLMQERAGTGRIYIQNVDHCNTHSPFDPKQAPIKQSNLCCEIALPTSPLTDVHGLDGEISLCTLAAINLGSIKDTSDFQPLANLLVRALDNLLDYQDYPVQAAYQSTMKRRPLGVGVINYAYYLAKNGVRYSDGSANNLTHKTFEALQHALLKASADLAKERGACPGFSELTYAKGILPTDTYKRELDKVCTVPMLCDWETLRQQIVATGLRNSTLTALMPSETSSQISNSTNGIEPPRGLVSVKASKDGILKQVVPDVTLYGLDYELLWNIPNNDGYLQLVGIMQKFVDQSISANTNYDPSAFSGGKVPMKQLIKDLLTAYKYGVKTLYYQNTRDGADDAQSDIDDGCASGACKL